MYGDKTSDGFYTKGEGGLKGTHNPEGGSSLYFP